MAYIVTVLYITDIRKFKVFKKAKLLKKDLTTTVTSDSSYTYCPVGLHIDRIFCLVYRYCTATAWCVVALNYGRILF